MKLHLGCGGIYLPGYINIDYPPAQQTSPHAAKSEVDEYAKAFIRFSRCALGGAL